MIRVTVRHVDSVGGILLGDLPPSEIRPLLELMGTTALNWGDLTDVGLNEDPAQFVEAGGTGAPRYCLEILLDGGG